MSFRNIIISSPAQISIKNGNLAVSTDELYLIPIEDITSILIENKQSSISTAALSELGACGCAVFLCDEKHMPCAILIPYAQHFRFSAMTKLQYEIGAVLKKRLWTKLVIGKVRNQATALDIMNYPNEAKQLRQLARNVCSNDSSNIEATAAKLYFRAMFGDIFVRGDSDDGRNVALNYGYSILRGYIARSIAVSGLLPSIGVHHRSATNAFNLADDIIEPFRPLVDILVAQGVDYDDVLTTKLKSYLFNCLNLDLVIDGKHYATAKCIELTVQAYANSIKKNKQELIIPSIIEPQMHQYE